jgi:predicted ester cyclase
MTNHVDTIRTYFDLCERKDYRAVAKQLIGDGYTYIDHTTDVVATTPQQLEAALVEDLQWSDQKFGIEQAIEGTNGAVVVLATLTQTLTGEWRSIEGTGQQVRWEFCDIFHFDGQGRIVGEELYGDVLSIMRQLGVVSV